MYRSYVISLYEQFISLKNTQIPLKVLRTFTYFECWVGKYSQGAGEVGQAYTNTCPLLWTTAKQKEITVFPHFFINCESPKDG